MANIGQITKKRNSVSSSRNSTEFKLLGPSFVHRRDPYEESLNKFVDDNID